MKVAAILLAAASLALADATPRGGTFNPRGLVEERRFECPNFWLMSAGGRFIATEIDNDGIGLFDTSTGKDLGLMGGAGRSRHDGNFGLSDRLLASTGTDGSVKVWNAITRKEILKVAPSPHVGYACSVSISADGKLLATGGVSDGTVKVFDIATGKETHCFPLGSGNVPSIEFDAKGTHVIASGPGNELRAIRLSTKTIYSLGEFGWIPEYRCSANGQFLAAGLPSGLVIWDARTWREVRRIPMDEAVNIHRHLAFTPDSRFVAAIDREGKIKFWDPATGALVHAAGSGLQPDGPIEFTPDGRVIAADNEGGVRVFGPRGASSARPAEDRK